MGVIHSRVQIERERLDLDAGLGWCCGKVDDRRLSCRTGSRSRGGIPNSIILGHYGGRPVAPTTTRTTRARAPAARRGRGPRNPAATITTVNTVAVRFVLRVDAVESVVDVELVLARRAILAEAAALFTTHEPYRVLDKLHRGAEDVRRAVEIRVRPRVGRIRFDTRLVQPEGVAFRELQELPYGRNCKFFCQYEPRSRVSSGEERTMSTLTQHPVPEVRAYFAHPQFENVITTELLYMLRKVAFVIDPSFTLLLSWHAIGICVRYLDVHDIVHNTEFIAFPPPSIGALT